MKFLLVLLVFLLGCSDPTYLPPNTNAGQNQPQEASCTLVFKNSGVCIDWKWEKVPTETEVGAFYFKTYRKNLVDGSMVLLDQASTPQIVLWMPSMNHGSSPVFTGQEDVGTYRAKSVFFIMPGEWEIKFQIKEGDQVLDEAIVSLTI
jgi:hypothetical protein